MLIFVSEKTGHYFWRRVYTSPNSVKHNEAIIAASIYFQDIIYYIYPDLRIQCDICNKSPHSVFFTKDFNSGSMFITYVYIHMANCTYCNRSFMICSSPLQALYPSFLHKTKNS